MDRAGAGLTARLWAYQKERFPVIKHGALIAAFSSCGVCLSSLLRNDPDWPGLHPLLVAFVVLFGLFAQLRIADEHKDAEVDARFRPTRPVPRGLISLAELRNVAFVIAVIQAAACLSLSWQVLLLLLPVWGFMALMSVEFFVPQWLRRHPVAYLVSHMAIMPIVDVWVTGVDWLPHSGQPPEGLGLFLLLSFTNGLILEVGRKTWSPDMEGEGIETYSSLWGLRPALSLWMVCVFLAVLLTVFLSAAIDFVPFAVLSSAGVLAASGGVGLAFWRMPDKGYAGMVETLSGVWVLIAYLTLGLVPMIWSLVVT